MAELRHLPAQKHDEERRQQQRPVANRAKVAEKLQYFLARREARAENHPDIGKTDFDGFLLSFTQTINSGLKDFQNTYISHQTQNEKITEPRWEEAGSSKRHRGVQGNWGMTIV